MMKISESYKHLKLQEMAEEDRPREKMIRHGQDILSNAELLGLIIGSGIANMTSVDLAQHILGKYNHQLHSMSQCSLTELQQFKGIGPAKAVLILSVLELSRRLQACEKEKKQKIKSTKAAYEAIRDDLRHKNTEEFWVMLLNNDGRLLKKTQISKGGITQTHVDPAVLLKEVLLHNSTQFIVAHNHPSGRLNPSGADIDLTERIEKAAQYVNVSLLDHMILTDEGYFSFSDHGMISPRPST